MKQVRLFEKTKLIILIRKYEAELKSGNLKHLKDYIGARVILALSPTSTILPSNEINKITLHSLMYLFNIMESEKKDFKVPNLYLINKTQIEYDLYLKKHFSISADITNTYAAFTWIELMISCKMISEDETIDLKKYKLIDFINDIELKNIVGISNVNDSQNGKNNKISNNRKIKIKEYLR